MYKTCPKCAHERTPEDNTDADCCPGCGLIFSKWMKTRFQSTHNKTENHLDRDPENSRSHQVLALIFYPGPPAESFVIAGRGLLLLIFAVWGWYFISLDLESNVIGESFMHRVNLVFHEAGHVLFRPFGWFMMILGGSLAQLLMPLIVLLSLLIKNSDAFGASFGLWWLGQSLMDLGPYINDARALQLTLLGGGTGRDRPGSHDWNNILLDLGLVEQDHRIAHLVDFIGSTVVIIALCWGGFILYQQYLNRKN